MDKDKPDLFDQIEGLTPVDPDTLAEFKREMIENVIPDIVRIVEKRRMLAAESRHRRLEVVAHKRKPSKD